MANRNTNNLVVPEAREKLNQFKIETASELGISNYENVDKGNLTSRENGSIGGYMVKKMVENFERTL